MPDVIVPAPYRGPTGGEERVRVEGETVEECLHGVERLHPGFAEQVFDGAGKVHRFVTLFINGEEIPRDGLHLPVRPADRIEILAAIAGG